MPLESDDAIRELLQATRRIAVVGIKADPQADAHRVPRYLQAQGYEILPVSPRLSEALGRPCVASLAELGAEEPAELVNLFRAARHVPAHAEEILALPRPPRGVWMQLGIAHPEASARLERAGIAVVEDRCLMLEHRRLLGGAA